MRPIFIPKLSERQVEKLKRISQFVKDNGDELNLTVERTGMKLIDLLSELLNNDFIRVYTEGVDSMRLYKKRNLVLLTLLKESRLDVLSVEDDGYIRFQSIQKMLSQLLKKVKVDAILEGEL